VIQKKNLSKPKEVLYITFAALAFGALMYGAVSWMKWMVQESRKPNGLEVASRHVAPFGCIWYVGLLLLHIFTIRGWYKYLTLSAEEKTTHPGLRWINPLLLGLASLILLWNDVGLVIK
jgi:hypothetical protein